LPARSHLTCLDGGAARSPRHGNTNAGSSWTGRRIFKTQRIATLSPLRGERGGGLFTTSRQYQRWSDAQ
jgi:hypothetical protein